MTYQANRLTSGYEHAKVLNPWVFADYGQPQRMRGYVSPLIYQTIPPTIYHPNLSGVGAEEMGQPPPPVASDERLALQRTAVGLQLRSVVASERMVVFGMVGASVALAGLFLTLYSNRMYR